MEIRDFREIGKRLMEQIPAMRNSGDLKTSLGRGAGGDRTFRIDREAEDIIITGFRELGEPLTFISEEAGIVEMGGGETVVIVDPVDGSKNAVSGIPFYCTSIAAAGGKTLGDIRYAYVLNLISGDEFWAQKGEGSFLNGRRLLAQKDEELYLTAYEAQSPPRDIPLILPLLVRSGKTRCLGATALDLCHLASGAVSAFVSPSPSRSFDFAAAYLIVREAGGVFTDMDGKDIEDVRLGLGRSSALLVSGNGRLHRKVLAVLRKKDEVV
ncbi:MAG: inositol monophosphatase family protein [Candidatus Sulfobium sp.]|jgi:myo-inositol-1(or 4)-monophosphatase